MDREIDRGWEKELDHELDRGRGLLSWFTFFSLEVNYAFIDRAFPPFVFDRNFVSSIVLVFSC